MKTARSYTYYKRLSHAARWFLPPQEAREIMEDYREMLGGMDDEAALIRFGPPVKAVVASAGWRELIGWNAVFLVSLILFILPPAAMYQYIYTPTYTVLPGLMLTALMFGWLGLGKDGRSERPLLPVWISVAMAAASLALFMAIPFVLDNTPIHIIWYYYSSFRQFVVILCAAGITFVVLARMQGRCWRSAAILCFVLISLCIYFLSITGSMDIDDRCDSGLVSWWWALVPVCGIALAEVGLC